MEANETPFCMEALRWNIDWQLTWSAVSLTRLAFFFFTSTSIFFCLDSNFKISNRVCSHDICLVFFRSWTYILQISTHVFYCIRCILQVSTYVLRFQHVFTIGIILSATERHRGVHTLARRPGVRFFSYLGSGFAQIFGLIVSITVKTLSNANLVALRYPWKGAHFLSTSVI